MKLCKCGCGATVTRKFVSGHNLKGLKKTKAHRAAIAEGLRLAWIHGRKGGGWGPNRKRMPLGSTNVRPDGYIVVKVHPASGTWRSQHLLVMEESIGRKLTRAEIVHHIDGDRANNALSNLYLCKNRSHHNEIHRSQDRAFRTLLKAGLVLFKDGVYEAIL